MPGVPKVPKVPKVPGVPKVPKVPEVKGLGFRVKKRNHSYPLNRTAGPSRRAGSPLRFDMTARPQTFRPSDPPTFRPSDPPTFRPSDPPTSEPESELYLKSVIIIEEVLCG